MDFYLSIDGARKGPYSLFKVGELLESGDVSGDSLAWHRDLDGWKPLREIPALEMMRERGKARAEESRAEESVASPPPQPESEPVNPHAGEIGDAPLPSTRPLDAPAPSGAAARTRPFVRFWARMFDYTAVSVLIFQLSDAAVPQPLPGESLAEVFGRYLAELQKPEALVFARTLFFALIGWHFLEAVLIHLFGTTPGKALFGIRVRKITGEPLPMKTSLGRSFYVYVLGVGFYQFPLILIGMIFSFFRIHSTGDCLWDQHLKIRVENPPLGALRIGLAFCAFFALFLLQSVKFS
ncbi:MAG: RDD family protein [Verrucomicrobiaceae bacterium]|nr:RDD family protein [Verrucomicrobiaceae bacterium]